MRFLRKIQFQALDKFVKENEKTFNEFATTVGQGLASALRGVVSILKFFHNNMTAIIDTIKNRKSTHLNSSHTVT